jgi:hypothetical protein
MIAVLNEGESLHEDCLICLLYLLNGHYTRYYLEVMLVEVS